MPKLFSPRSAPSPVVPAESEPPMLPFYRPRRMNRWAKLAVYVGLALACFGYGFAYARFAPFLMVPFAIPLALLAVLVIWALPSGEYAPTKALQPLYIAFFAALFLWPGYLAIALPGLPWITLLRLTGLPLLLVMLVCLSVSDQFRRRVIDIFSYDPWISRMFVAFFVLATLSVGYSMAVGPSASRYIVAITNWFCIFFVSLVLFSRPGFARRWMWLFISMATMVCIVGAYESRIHHVVWSNHIPSILKIEDEAVLRALSGLSRAATGKYRVQGTYGTPLGLAEFLGLVAPFAVHLILTSKTNGPRIFASGYILLALYVVLETDSRLGLISSLLSMLLYILFWALLQWRRNKGSIIAPAIVLSYPAIFVVGVAATFAIGRLRAKFWGNGAQSASDQSRVDQWNIGIPKILNHPWGYGLGQSGNALNYVGPDGIQTIDSYFLSVLLEYGVIGFILYYGMFARGAWIGARTIARGNVDDELQLLMPLSICLIDFIVIKAVFSQDDNHPLAFMILGAVVALCRRADLAQPQAESSATSTQRLSLSARSPRPRLQPAASGLRRETSPGRN